MKKKTAIILSAVLALSAFWPDIGAELPTDTPAVAIAATRKDAENSMTSSEWEIVRMVNA